MAFKKQFLPPRILTYAEFCYVLERMETRNKMVEEINERMRLLDIGLDKLEHDINQLYLSAGLPLPE